MKIKLIVPLLLLPMVLAGEAKWIFKMESEGIRSYTRSVKGWEVHQAKGVGYIDAPFEKVIKARLDFNRFFKNNSNMNYYKILLDDGPYHKVVYGVVDVPWPASDRDVIFDVTVTLKKNSMITLSRSITSFKGAPKPGKNMVRMLKMEEKHTFIRKGKRTLLITESLADPGGKLPKGLINMMLGSAPIKTVKTMRKIVRGGK